VAQISEAQRLENERKAAQLEQERVRLAQERERLDADKLQREKAKQTASIAIQASASQPDAFGEVTLTIRTNADTSSLKLNGDELGGKADGVYTAKRVARAGQETKFTVVARDLYGNTDSKVVTVSRPLSEAKESFAELNAQAGLPVYALGGQSAATLDLVRSVGGHGFAGIRAWVA
jgi:hypothetical protein